MLFDPTQYSQSNRAIADKLLPGSYVCNIERAQVRENQRGINYVNIMLRVVGPIYANRTDFVVFSIWHENEDTQTKQRRNFAELCLAARGTPDVLASIEDLVGLQVGVIVSSGNRGAIFYKYLPADKIKLDVVKQINNNFAGGTVTADFPPAEEDTPF